MRETWTTDVTPPPECTCTRMIADTLDETLNCPEGWKWLPWADTWVHQ